MPEFPRARRDEPRVPGRRAGWPARPGPPNSSRIVAVNASRSSSSGIENSPWISSTGSSAVTPIGVQLTSCSAASATNALSCPRGTATSARPADSLNSHTNGGVRSSGSVTRAPMLRRRQLSTSTWARPPSDRSCAALTWPAREALASSAPSACSWARSTFGGRPPRWPWVDPGPLRAGQLARPCRRAGRAGHPRRSAAAGSPSGRAGPRRRRCRARRPPGSGGSPRRRSGCRS